MVFGLWAKLLLKSSSFAVAIEVDKGPCLPGYGDFTDEGRDHIQLTIY
jgi:hypothetical protein